MLHVEFAGSSPHTRGARSDVQPSRPATGIIPAYAGSTRRCPTPADSHWDHPRIRGEHSSNPARAAGGAGSSPHTRGAQRRERRNDVAQRIIPAYAGSTAGAIGFGATAADHPRIRGEHDQTDHDTDLDPGSSPHTRGALASGSPEPGPERIIPAYAGSTCRAYPSRQLCGDHPRIRGEHVIDLHMQSYTPGSSPHTRGAPSEAYGTASNPGIIPAYAGSTRGGLAGCVGAEDHPRIRGEHGDSAWWDPEDPGSSPHTRGAPRGPGRHPRGGGIIPAYAGSTFTCFLRSPNSADHPRIRGEHGAPGTQAAGVDGSSPHTRGARRRRRCGGSARRIIPAYAGSTSYQRVSYPMVGDHPRIRGEHGILGPEPGVIRGSSPHTRGAHSNAPRFLYRLGIIPAYAGSTVCTSSGGMCERDHPRIRGEHIGVPFSLRSDVGSSPHTRGARGRRW